MELEELKPKVLKLLKEDEGFRYAVAGLIGLSEILKRLDRHEEELIKLREDLNVLRKDMLEVFKRHDEILVRHEEQLIKLREDMNRLREDMNRGFKLIDRRLRYLEAYTERASLTLEEEAMEVIAGKLSRRGLKVRLDRLILPDMEVNIYGATDDLCVVGEAATRAGVRVVEELDDKFKELASRHPDYVKGRAVKVLYTMWITQEAVEEAKKRGIWVLKTTQELTPLSL